MQALSSRIRPTHADLLALLREASAEWRGQKAIPKVRAQISDLVAGFSEHSSRPEE
jgi:hypothetical protein